MDSTTPATHELSENELHAQSTQKINEFAGYLKNYAKEDDDLIQEGNIGVYNAIKEKGGATKIKESYFKTKMKFVITNYLKKGKSIDNGFWKRDTINIIPCDSVNSDVSANILKDTYSKPVDEQVIDKVALENLLSSLSETEKRFIHLRIMDWGYIQITKKLRLTTDKLNEIRQSVRSKINTAYA
jgi:DNA-directed RNA polymerase specialized sigma24 family protein